MIIDLSELSLEKSNDPDVKLQRSKNHRKQLFGSLLPAEPFEAGAGVPSLNPRTEGFSLSTLALAPKQA